jgi:hypothetical protein
MRRNIHRARKACATVPAPDRLRRQLLGVLAASPAIAQLAACGGGSSDSSVAPAATRTWKMGFFPTPPRLDVAAVFQGIDLMSERGEIVHIQQELPWTDLLAGMTAEAAVDRDLAALVTYCRGKGLRIGFCAELNDGLSRGEEAPQLRALGRSIAEPAVQQVYRTFVLAVSAKLQPDYLGLAAETNLVRVAAPPALYAGVKQAANAAAADLSAAGATAPLMISVQVEAAWGVLGTVVPYRGIDADFTDFPFLRLLGLSTYPYFGHAQPDDVPGDYYSRLLSGRDVPVMVSEGGWTSASVGGISSSQDLQARYLTRQAGLLDGVRATAVVQTLFADLDLASLPPPLPANLPLFASLGIVDSNFKAKSAQAVWDGLFARRLL